MSLNKIVAEIKNEIARLTQVLALLTGARPKGKWKKRMSADAKRKIGAAQKRRWAKIKREARKK